MVTLGRWLMTEWVDGVDGNNGMVVDNGAVVDKAVVTMG